MENNLNALKQIALNRLEEELLNAQMEVRRLEQEIKRLKYESGELE